jgi:large subunit ribosomal protein L30
MVALAIVRIRGHMRINHEIAETMERLNLTRANHCVIVPQTDEVQGMVQKVKDYCTFGPVSAAEIESLIRTRGRLVGDKPVTDEYLKTATKLGGIKDVAAAIEAGKVKWSKVEGVKPMFRLNPPKKGFKGGTKRSYRAHGSLGDRGKAMPELIARMI